MSTKIYNALSIYNLHFNNMEKTILFDITEYTSIQKSKELYTQLYSLLKDKKTITLKANTTKDLHTSCAQILLAFIYEAKKMNITIEWCDVSQNFSNSISQLGIKNLIFNNTI